MQSILIALLLLGESPASSPTPEMLRESSRRWAEQVSFGCRFRLRSEMANSMEQAEKGEYDPKLGSAYSRWEARGEFQKIAARMRCLVEFGPPGYQYGPTKFDITLEPVEEATNGSIEVRRLLRRSEILGEEAKSVLVMRRGESEGRMLLAGLMTTASVLPLAPIREDAGQPFGSLPITRIQKLDPDHVEVLCEIQQQGRIKETDFSETQNRRVVFWMTPDPPVIEKIEERVERRSLKDPKLVLGSEDRRAILSDFKSCPGGMVATHVRYLDHAHGLKVLRWKIDEPGVRVFDWKSDDLGQSPPTDADFVLSVPPDWSVLGLKTKLPMGEVRSLDVNKLGPTDLDELEVMTAAYGPPFLQTGIGRLLLSWAVAAGLLGIVTVWSFLRRLGHGPIASVDGSTS
ncbi:hypothetical protein [Paludisphaera borealis]|uniref:Uncharacterized protein n=1 Tax=Paludisphaera borealis TaxID=1387353 RepID=A0A1U7CLC6_9BACT|nr:hypothetical protein [Paludisphaera borealis]APW59729.1 hypothetical protein BSF38_01160 [Paludisphaera borealis]